MDVAIRRLTAEDAARLARVADEVFDLPVDPARLAAYLAAPGRFMLVAIAGGRVVGQCAAVIHRHPDKGTELYVDEVGVAPDFRRQGVARRLLDEMLALGKAAGCEEAWVGTEHHNRPARGLYESRGATAEPFVLYVFALCRASSAHAARLLAFRPTPARRVPSPRPVREGCDAGQDLTRRPLKMVWPMSPRTGQRHEPTRCSARAGR